MKSGVKVYLLSTMAILLSFCLFFNQASAEGFVLPEKLEAIAEYAFSGDESVEYIFVPDGCTLIGESAFKGCANLNVIRIPASVTSIGANCFEGCSADMLITTTAGSTAQYYASYNNVDYQADTKYRALFICQTYAGDDELSLSGPINDAAAIEGCLNGFKCTDYSFDVRSNLTANGIASAISDAFGSAKAQDVSLFYYSGHGVSSWEDDVRGALLGADGYSYMTAAQLRSALDGILGRKIVIIDACYSGTFINSDIVISNSISAVYSDTDAHREYDAADFTNAFISAFSTRKRRGAASGEYFIITAAADYEESYEDKYGAKTLGVFTNALTEGCGYNASVDLYSSLKADTNANMVITIQEAYYYAWRICIRVGQHVQVYPENCDWFGFLRK